MRQKKNIHIDGLHTVIIVKTIATNSFSMHHRIVAAQKQYILLSN